MTVREIRAADVAFLRQLIAENPTLSRCALSVRVCQAWNWVQPNGQLRDMVCRSLMLRLHRAGHIELPAPKRTAINNAIRHRHVGAVAAVAGSGLTLLDRWDVTPDRSNQWWARWRKE